MRLHNAVATGNLTEVKYLIETLGYSPNNSGFFDWFLRTPLAIAAKQNQSEMVDYLIEKGADVNARGELGFGHTPMEIALEHKYTPVVASLLAANAGLPDFKYALDSLNNAKKTELVTGYLVKAASANDTASIEKILKNEFANINEKHFDSTADIKFTTPLQAAASGNHIEATALLIEKGASISECSAVNWKKHPLDLATEPKLIELLIEHTPQVSKCLFGAVLSGNEKLIKLLVNNGADIDFEELNPAGGSFTALEFAILKDDSAMIKVLVENGAKISANDTNSTPLEFAAEQGKLQALATLIELGSDLSHENANGETAFDLAMKAGPTQALPIFNMHDAKFSNVTDANLDEQKPVELDITLTNDEIMPSVVSEAYDLQETNSTISDNSQSVEEDIQPTNSTLLISIDLNDVLCDEQMIMPAEQSIELILQADNSTVSDHNQTEAIYILPVSSLLAMVEHEQIFVG